MNRLIFMLALVLIPILAQAQTPTRTPIRIPTLTRTPTATQIRMEPQAPTPISPVDLQWDSTYKLHVMNASKSVLTMEALTGKVQGGGLILQQVPELPIGTTGEIRATAHGLFYHNGTGWIGLTQEPAQ